MAAKILNQDFQPHNKHHKHGGLIMEIHEMQHSDLVSVNKWLKGQGRPNLKSEYCGIKLIVRGVASATLLRSEGDLCIMDSLVTNPLCSSETRHKALDALYTHIKQLSVDLGYKRLIGFTTSESTLYRSMAHGFTPQPHVLLTLETK